MDFKISVDNLTIVGVPIEKALAIIQNPYYLHDVTGGWITPTARYHYNFKALDTIFLQMTHAGATNPSIRIEFNPNKITDDRRFKTVRRLLSTIKEPNLSRIDVALDVYGEDLSDYKVIDFKTRKRGTYQSRSGKIETLYIGSRGSDEQIRIYDKALEQGIKKEAEEAGNNWWRIEAQMRGKKAKEYEKHNPFDGISIQKTPENLNGYDVQTKAMIEYLNSHTEAWGELNRNTRRKYKNLIGALGIQLDVDIHQVYETKKRDLIEQVNEWLNISEAANPSPLKSKPL